MKRLTRREFLRALAGGVGSLVINQLLIACGHKPQTISPTPVRIMSPTSSPSPTPPTEAEVTSTEASPPNGPTPTPPGLPDLAVASTSGDGDLLAEELVRAAIGALGGIERFVPRGSSVIIKPNICIAYHTYEYAATTNPWVVGALVKLCVQAGAKSVKVMDGPFGGNAPDAYGRSGIAEQVIQSGGDMVVMPRIKYVATEIPGGEDLQTCQIYDDVLKTDVLIDVPIAKTHGLARLTLGMKNLMGVIQNRSALHSNLGQRLADLTSRIYPTLTVVDAIRMLMANGPTGGNLDDVRKTNTVIASPDIVAVDSYAATLFGLKPADLDYVVAGERMGLGSSQLDYLQIEEIALGV